MLKTNKTSFIFFLSKFPWLPWHVFLGRGNGKTWQFFYVVKEEIVSQVQDFNLNEQDVIDKSHTRKCTLKLWNYKLRHQFKCERTVNSVSTSSTKITFSSIRPYKHTELHVLMQSKHVFNVAFNFTTFEQYKTNQVVKK